MAYGKDQQIETMVHKVVDNAVCELNERIETLQQRLQDIESKRSSRANAAINRVEAHDGNGQDFAPREESRMRMGYEDKIVSMVNAVKILPPNMIKDGRHAKENVQAICGFMVDEEMMDEVYSQFSHDEG